MISEGLRYILPSQCQYIYDFQHFVDYELYRDPGMSDANFEAKTEELMQMKADYMWGDNFTRAGIMRKMGKMKIDQDSMDESITEFAEAGSKSGGKSGLSEAWTGSKMAKDIGKQLMNPKSYYNDENILVTDITIDGVTKPYSKSDIDELREKVSFDQTSNDVIVAMQGRIMDSPSDFEADGNPGVVSEQKVRYAVRQGITDKGTHWSLANDKIAGKVFKTELKNYMGGKLYSDILDGDNFYGITKAQAIKHDPTKGDDMITPKDIDTIVNKLMEDEALFSETLEDYFTGMLMGTYNNANPQNVDQHPYVAKRKNENENTPIYNGGEI